MKRGWKMSLITLIVGVAAFILGPSIWPPSPDIRPTPSQVPYLMGLSAIEALVFGFGIAFVFYGLPLVKRMARGSRKTAGIMYVSLAWLLVSWWPHDNLHIYNALDIGGLIAIEYAFHVTVIVVGLLLAYSFFVIFKPTGERVEAHEECPADRPDCHLAPTHP